MKICITGVSRGIGRALCEIALEHGHDVFGVARTQLASSTHGFTRHPRFKLFLADVAHPQDMEKLSDQISQATPSLDVLINNAGVLHDRVLDFDHTTADVLEQTFQVNVIGVHVMTQSLKKLLLKSAQPKVFSVSSMMGSITDNSSGKYYAYRTSKAALNMWNKSFSIDHPKITAVVLHPGWVATEMGGPQAPVTPQISAAGILNLAEKLGLNQSGKFYDYQGNELAW